MEKRLSNDLRLKCHLRIRFASLPAGSPVGLKSKRFVLETLLVRGTNGGEQTPPFHFHAPKEFQKQTFSILAQPESRLAGYHFAGASAHHKLNG